MKLFLPRQLCFCFPSLFDIKIISILKSHQALRPTINLLKIHSRTYSFKNFEWLLAISSTEFDGVVSLESPHAIGHIFWTSKMKMRESEREKKKRVHSV